LAFAASTRAIKDDWKCAWLFSVMFQSADSVSMVGPAVASWDWSDRTKYDSLTTFDGNCR